MPLYWKRYGVADSIEYPLIKRGVVDFAVSGDYTPVQSDVRIHIDAASASYATNVQLATGSHGWSLPMLGSELAGKRITVTVVDASTKAVEDQFIIIETYGSPLAQHQFDLSINTVTVATVSSGAITDASLNNSAVFKITSNVWATGSRALSQTSYDQLVNQVWITPSRTLSSVAALLPDIVNAVWATGSKTLSQSAYDQLVNQVWATGSRTVSSLDAQLGAITNAVWSTGSRTLTQGAYDQVTNQIWATGSRTLSAGGNTGVADAILARNVSGGSSTGRTVSQAFHVLRNKVDARSGEVFDTDDSSVSWTFTTTTDSDTSRITIVDPA